MDPNATLDDLRDALMSGDHEAAAECARSLDEWLSRGGFLPDAWHVEQM